MHHTAKMEQFSRAYVAVIAAQAGCNPSRPEVDNDSVDLELCMKDIPNCRRTRGRVAIQLKCTHAVDRSKDEIAFALPVKNYNDLRADVMEPRLLVLVCVPEDCEAGQNRRKTSFACATVPTGFPWPGNPKRKMTAQSLSTSRERTSFLWTF